MQRKIETQLAQQENVRIQEFLDMVAQSNGYRFVTWLYTYDRSGVTLGYYYPNNYSGAKEEFATRSGLVSEYRLFNKEQLLDLYRAVSYSLDERADLTFKQEDALKEIKGQIESAEPSATAVLEVERQTELMQAPGFKMGGM